MNENYQSIDDLPKLSSVSTDVYFLVNTTDGASLVALGDIRFDMGNIINGETLSKSASAIPAMGKSIAKMGDFVFIDPALSNVTATQAINYIINKVDTIKTNTDANLNALSNSINHITTVLNDTPTDTDIAALNARCDQLADAIAGILANASV